MYKNVNESTIVCSLRSLALNKHTFTYTHKYIQKHLHTNIQIYTNTYTNIQNTLKHIYQGWCIQREGTGIPPPPPLEFPQKVGFFYYVTSSHVTNGQQWCKVSSPRKKLCNCTSLYTETDWLTHQTRTLSMRVQQCVRFARSLSTATHSNTHTQIYKHTYTHRDRLTDTQARTLSMRVQQCVRFARSLSTATHSNTHTQIYKHTYTHRDRLTDTQTRAFT